MRIGFVFLFLCSPLTLVAQKILQPTQGRSYVELKAGNVYHYYDDGGIESNYSQGASSVFTIYPAKKGEYVTISCNNFEVNTDCRMYIFDGNHPGAQILGEYYAGSSNRKNQLLPGDVIRATSTNASGAISIRFTNTGSRGTKAGWDFTVTSSKESSSAMPETTQDCSGAIKVCSDSSITTRASGCNFQELPGPNYWHKILNYGRKGENQSNWYKFEVATSGTIEFLIIPLQTTDFDWALWGPYKSHQCPAFTADEALRVSACDHRNSLVTGLSANAQDFKEGSSGDGYVAPIQVKTGEHYVLMIDDWSGNNSTFKLNWKFTNGASLECKEDKEPPTTADELIQEDEDVEVLDSTENESEQDLKFEDNGPKLEAELSEDQEFVTVSYPGAFEYKIENEANETVITGHSVNSDEVEITHLPAGKYRVSLIYKKIKQYTVFEKD